MKKKVLLAITSLAGGGAERVVSVWANELNARGYDVSVLVFARMEGEYALDEGVNMCAIAENNGAYLSLSYPQRLMKMRRMLKKLRPDCIISFLPTMQIWMLFASMGLKIRRIETIRNNPWQVRLNPIAGRIWRHCYRSADGIIVQARDQIPFFSDSEQKKCMLIPNPISEAYMDHCKTEISGDCVRFIAAGRLNPQKNYPMMIRAFAQAVKAHPGIALRIFGKGSEAYTEKIRALIAELGMEENIRLMGRSNRMEAEYQNADAFIMSSDFEGLPNALMEAMASRLVCISTDCKTGPADLIDDGINGYLVPVGDEKALADGILRTAEMSGSEREKMADAAREKILRHCSRKNSLEQLCRLLEKN